jgi:ATP-dependent helicase/nuclease subunit A
MYGQELSHSDPSIIQRLASDPASSVFVSASAGTGKTKVLCDRFVRLMLEGNSPEQILCITFTNAAAAEMKLRIQKVLLAWNQASDVVLQSELERLLGDFNDESLSRARRLYNKFIEVSEELRIQTIHSFCASLLSDHSDYLGEAEDVQIIDDYKCDQLLKQAFTEVWTQQNEVALIAECIVGLGNFYDKEEIFQFVKSNLKQHKLNLIKSANSFSRVEVVDVNLVIANFFEKEELLDIAALEVAIKERNFQDYYYYFYTKDLAPRAKFISEKFAKTDPVLYEKIQAQLILLEQTREQICDSVSVAMSQDILTLSYLTLAGFEDLKKNNGYYQYDDLLIGAIDLLQGSEESASVLYNLDYQINHILVDEAQDLSQTQWKLVQILTEEFFAGDSARQEILRTIFIVGDFKQSIYGFQGAAPHLFDYMKGYFAKKVQDANLHWRELEMNTSFRTTRTVLKTVDRIFATKHLAYRNGDGYAKVYPLICNEDKKKHVGWIIPDIDTTQVDLQLETARYIAAQVASWLGSGRNIIGKSRDVLPADILILVRKRGPLTKHLLAEFKKLKIPVSNQDKVAFVNELIVKDLISLIKFILFPDDKLNLASLLKSPFFGVSEAELYELAPFLGAELPVKFSGLNDKLQSYIQSYKQQDPLYFFIKVFEKDGYREKFLSRFGDRANLVLDEFIRLLNEKSQQEFMGFAQVLFWMENSGHYIAPLPTPKGVQIMTAHNSKGLQAPIVILADAASSEQSPHEQMFWRENKFYFSSYAEFDNQAIKNVKSFFKEQSDLENKRLLYVAMTRAEDELHVFGWDNNRVRGSWYQTIYDKLEVMQEIALEQKKCLEAPMEEQIPGWLSEKLDNPNLQECHGYSVAYDEGVIIGELVHSLLESGLQLTHEQRVSFIERFSYKFLNKQAIETICRNVEKVILKFPELFVPEVRSEVPIVAELDGRMLRGRIDKLIIKETMLQLYDFKTDIECDAQRLMEYKQQLNGYKQALSLIYPERTISAHLIFIHSLERIDL